MGAVERMRVEPKGTNVVGVPGYTAMNRRPGGPSTLLTPVAAGVCPQHTILYAWDAPWVC